MNQEHKREARAGAPVNHRLSVRNADVTLWAGERAVAHAPRTAPHFPLVETARAVARLHERSREALDPERIAEAVQLTDRMGQLLAERAGNAVCRALSDAARDAVQRGETLSLALDVEPGPLAGLPWETLLLPGASAPLALHPVIRPFRTGPGDAVPLGWPPRARRARCGWWRCWPVPPPRTRHRRGCSTWRPRRPAWLPR